MQEKDITKTFIGKIRAYTASFLGGVGGVTAFLGSVAVAGMVAGWPAGLLALGAGAVGVMMFAAAPMEFASKGMKLAAVALPIAFALGGGALGGLVYTTALAGVAGAALGAVVAAAGFGLVWQSYHIAPPENGSSGLQEGLGKLPGRSLVGLAGKLTAAAAIGFGAYQYKDAVKELPLMKPLYTQQADKPKA